MTARPQRAETRAARALGRTLLRSKRDLVWFTAVQEAAAGHEVIIAKAGRHVAKLVPLQPVRRPKKFGGLKGRIRVPDNFNAPLDARFLAAFEGRS